MNSAFCPNCGTRLNNGQAFCSNCGTKINQQPQYNQQQYNNQSIEQKGNFGWAVLGYFIPLVGLILYCVWKNERPGDARMAGKGALTSVIVSVVLSIFMSVFAWSIIENIINAID